jgi:hypothetical protein
MLYDPLFAENDPPNPIVFPISYDLFALNVPLLTTADEDASKEIEVAGPYMEVYSQSPIPLGEPITPPVLQEMALPGIPGLA